MEPRTIFEENFRRLRPECINSEVTHLILYYIEEEEKDDDDDDGGGGDDDDDEFR
jgi:hypothetical protein